MPSIGSDIILSLNRLMERSKVDADTCLAFDTGARMPLFFWRGLTTAFLQFRC